MSMTTTSVIEAARQRIGNQNNRSIDQQWVPTEAVQAEMRESVVEISKLFGSGSSRKDIQFTTIPQQQDYSIATYVAADVRDIEEVLRSDAYVSESFLEPTQVDPRTGVPVARAAFIDQAYQQNALDVIVAQERFRRQDMYDWEVVNSGGVLSLRLMPPPTEASIVSVRYVSTSEDVSTLPEEAREAAENAACVAILECMLNRVNSAPSATRESALDRRYWVEMMERQRDRYERKYRRAIQRAPKCV